MAKSKENQFKLTASSVRTRCHPPGPGEINGNGKAALYSGSRYIRARAVRHQDPKPGLEYWEVDLAELETI